MMKFVSGDLFPFFANIKDKVPDEDVPVSSLMNANDSWDLDLSDTKLPKSKLNLDQAAEADKGAGIVPGRGQKTVAKRLKKITDTLARGLIDTEQIEKRITKQKASKSAKTKSPPKRNARGRTSRRQYYVDSDLEMGDSDSDTPIAVAMSRPTGRSPRRPPCRAHDPNTIVLDCGDELFAGGSAVAFSRNIAQAESISIEDSRNLKVNVKIDNKIEQYEMNAFQKLTVLQSQISAKKNVPSDHVVLMFKEKTVSEHETPNSIGYIQGLVIKALISAAANKSKNTNSSTTNDNSNKLEIKIQTQDRKRPFVTYINPSDQLITLAFACAEEFKCDVDKVALEFHGEFINFKETAEDLALEGGEMMDFFKKKQ